MQGGETEGEIDPQRLTTDDKWILLRLDTAIREINDAFSEYRFTEAAQVLYRFFWSEYCDWYIEASKAVFYSQDTAAKANTLAVIDFVLSITLRLFHPFLPFITEELWHGMGFNKDLPETQGNTTIMAAHWPKPFDEAFNEHYGLDESDERWANARYDLVSQARNLRRESNIASNKKVKFVLKPGNQISSHDGEVLKLLLNADPFVIDPNYSATKGTPSIHSVVGELFLPLEGLIDVEAEKIRHQKNLEKSRIEIEKIEQKLSNTAFTQKAPPEVLEEQRKRLADWQNKQQQILQALELLAS